MTDPKTTDILAIDHERGCAGREYACTCGYDSAKDAEIERLRSVIGRLRDKVDQETRLVVQAQIELSDARRENRKILGLPS